MYLLKEGIAVKVHNDGQQVLISNDCPAVISIDVICIIARKLYCGIHSIRPPHFLEDRLGRGGPQSQTVELEQVLLVDFLINSTVLIGCVMLFGRTYKYRRPNWFAGVQPTTTSPKYSAFELHTNVSPEKLAGLAQPSSDVPDSDRDKLFLT